MSHWSHFLSKWEQRSSAKVSNPRGIGWNCIAEKPGMCFVLASPQRNASSAQQLGGLFLS